MVIWRVLSKTQSDQNVHKNAPNCNIFSKFSRVAYAQSTLSTYSMCATIL